VSPQEPVKLLIIGGPCTGKSTLQTALHDTLQEQGHDVALVHEYARRYLKKTGGYQDAFERLIVYLGSLHTEEEAEAHILIFDDAPFINIPYGRLYRPTEHHLLHKWDEGLRLMEALERESAAKFLIYFLPSGVFAAHNDSERFNAEDQEDVSGHILSYLKEYGAEYHTVMASSVEARVQEILADLAQRQVI
jgi:hypothetical protein